MALSTTAPCKQCGLGVRRPPSALCGKCMYVRYNTDLCACGARKGRKRNTCKACMPRGGAFHSQWKGGRKLSVTGYVMVHNPEHPNSQKSGYVMEHIAVMTEHMGRPLLPHENVHHINGVKDDNRIENLELWSVSQPKGQRVSDKLAWAREIIELYGSEAS